MKPETLTAVIIVSTIALISLIDLLMLWQWGPEGTISRTLRHWNESRPLLAMLVSFAVGCLLGHFFL